MAKDKKTYGIRTTTYVRKPTGEIYPEDVKPSYLAGKRKYGPSEKKSEKVINDTWGNLKQKVYKASESDKNVSVRWGKPETKRLKSVTKEYSDGRKETTYYTPVRTYRDEK